MATANLFRTVRASAADEVELFSLAAQIPYDDRVNQRAAISDLHLPLIKAFLRDIGSLLADQADSMSFDDLCHRMAITDGPAEHTLPRNVGLIFFNEEPERFFPQAQIDVVLFPDGPGGSGPLLQLPPRGH